MRGWPELEHEQHAAHGRHGAERDDEPRELEKPRRTLRELQRRDHRFRRAELLPRCDARHHDGQQDVQHRADDRGS